MKFVLLSIAFTLAQGYVVKRQAVPPISDTVVDAPPDQAKPSKTESKPEIYQLHVKSEVYSRFARTLVTSRLANGDEEAKEAVFVVQLPDAAFISNFTMEIDNEIIVGEVKEKEEAKQDYEAAKAAGQSTGLVAQAPRETNTFHISVNVEAQGKVTFNLTYQEILQRVHGVYKHIVNIQPGQVVNDLRVDVAITEEKEITTLVVPEFGEKVGEKANQDILKLPKAKDVSIKEVITAELSRVEIGYTPKPQKQKELQKEGKKGLAGQLVVLYDVKREPSGGDIQVINGYFVHFFAPSNIPVAPKHAIFVLDTSGSMSGRKIEQTKDAMRVILKDLNAEDTFNIIEFDSVAREWMSESVLATEENIEAATVFVNGLNAGGGTNINDALFQGLDKLLAKDSPESINPVIIFLTDGIASIDLNNIKKRNNEQLATIQTIAFGTGADFDLLKRLSLENHGLARKIYEDSDAALQLQGFYAEISSLLLRDVEFTYFNETVELDSVVQDNTFNYYDGSEFVVAGKLKSPIVDKEEKPQFSLDAQISGVSASGPQHFLVDVPDSPRCRLLPTPCPACSPSPCDAALRPCRPSCPPCDPSPRWTCDTPPRCRIVWVPLLACGACEPPPAPCPPCGHQEYICDDTLPPIEPEQPYDPLGPETIGGIIERMWAYLSIKKMLEQAKYDTKANSTGLKEKALEMSLKYNFVTELTSMVVVQPDKNETTALGEGDVPQESFDYGFGGGIPQSSASFAAGAMGPVGFGGHRGRPAASSFQGIPAPLPAWGPAAAPGPSSQDLLGLPQPTFRPATFAFTTTYYFTTTDTPQPTTTGPVCSVNETNISGEAEGCETGCGENMDATKTCDFPLYCRCKKGYKRAMDATCMLDTDCEPVPAILSQVCKNINGIYRACGNCAKTCTGKGKAQQMNCDRCSVGGCACAEGFAGDPSKNICVKESDCSSP